MEFDSVLAKAAGPLLNTPMRTHLSEREIERMAQYQFASMLEEDEEVRREGTGSEELFQAIARQLQEAGVASPPQFALNVKPAYGLKQPSRSILFEFDHAVRRFIELHGDLRIVDIRRSHVRQFREALQAIPVRRSGALMGTLPELVERAKLHAGEKKDCLLDSEQALGRGPGGRTLGLRQRSHT